MATEVYIIGVDADGGPVWPDENAQPARFWGTENNGTLYLAFDPTGVDTTGLTKVLEADAPTVFIALRGIGAPL